MKIGKNMFLSNERDILYEEEEDNVKRDPVFYGRDNITLT